MRSWIISVIAALGFVASAFLASAQQADQGTRQQLERIVAAYHDNWNNHNAAGIADLYTKDGILVTQSPKVVKTGQQEIEQQYQDTFKAGIAHDDGHWTAVYVRDGGAWKIRLLTAFPNPPPTPPAR